MGLLSRPRYAYRVVRNAMHLRDWRYGREIADRKLPVAGLSVNKRGLHFADLGITFPHGDESFYMHLESAVLLKRLAGVNFHDSEQGTTATAPGFTVHVNSGEEFYILREILCDGAYNFGTAAENVVVWDIGMNAGFASLYFAARPSVRAVVSFEPFRPTFDAAVRNVGLNPELRTKIKMHNFGIAANAYSTTAEYNSTWKGHSSVRGISSSEREQLNIPDRALTVERIELHPADEVLRSILADYPNHTVVAKIDCEGSEYEILRRLYEKRLLQKINIIMLEWHQHGPAELEGILHESGFSTYSLASAASDVGMIYAINQSGPDHEEQAETSLASSNSSETKASAR